MTFTEHLAELRTRIIRVFIAVGVGFIVCFIFSQQIINIISAPLRVESPIVRAVLGSFPQEPAGGVAANTAAAAPKPSSSGPHADFVTLGPLEPFLVRVKVAAYAGLALAFPVVLYQLCAFVFPGLKPEERNVAKFLIVGCGVLASSGIVIAYYGVFPLVLPYLLQYNPDWVTTQLHLDQTISLIIKGLLGFSVAFQFPKAVLILVYLGVLHPSTLKKYRKIAIVLLAFVSAMFTPPDPFSMMILMIPLVGLYELSILLSYVVLWRRPGPNPQEGA
jgi:sec-independent protein translocase protein TatC